MTWRISNNNKSSAKVALFFAHFHVATFSSCFRFSALLIATFFLPVTLPLEKRIEAAEAGKERAVHHYGTFSATELFPRNVDSSEKHRPRPVINWDLYEYDGSQWRHHFAILLRWESSRGDR